MDFSRFINEIRRNEFRPAYLFLGKEDYLAEIGVQELIGRLLSTDEKDLNLTSLTARDAEAIAQALSTPPMFAARRVVLIKQAGDLKDKILDEITAYLTKPPSDACLILWAGEPDKRKSFAKRVEKLIDPVQCNKLKPEELNNWIIDYSAKYQKKLDNDAITRLSGVNWPSLRELAGELDRLTLMIGDKAVISVADIEEMGGGSVGLDRWGLSNAIGDGNITSAISAAQNLKDWGVQPNQIIGDIYRIIRQLWFVRWHIDNKKTPQAKSALGVQDFIFNKLQKQAGAFSLVRLEEALLRVLDAELSIKRGNRKDDFEAILVVTDVISVLTADNLKRGAA